MYTQDTTRAGYHEAVAQDIAAAEAEVAEAALRAAAEAQEKERRRRAAVRDVRFDLD